ncbi:cytochrome P450 [Plastorhodobacter daqingensis]|uniref:Cytochrome P450 n=1 Tax=Plastorhodobacter daqingensis TaxID=1387281 RepID=A0ABW2UMN2_9RHOB
MRRLSTIPRDPVPDATRDYFRDGAEFISRRAERLGSDIFETRLWLQPVICLRGPEALALFYGGTGLRRLGPGPRRLLRLPDHGGRISQTEGPAHQARKALFIRLLMAPGRTAALAELFRSEWAAALPGWERQERLILGDALTPLLARVGWRWCGLEPDEAGESQLSALARASGRGRQAPLLRYRLVRRLCRHLYAARTGRFRPQPDSPLAQMLAADQGGPLRQSADDLVDIICAVTAVSDYIIAAALTLVREPVWCALFRAGNAGLIEDFVEEVRRITPLAPVVAARSVTPLPFSGHVIPSHRTVLLDLRSPLLDAGCFPEPTRFRPERMLSWRQAEPGFVPQGGGEVALTHRCPGEAATVALMAEAVAGLCHDLHWTVPPQDLRPCAGPGPAVPRSRLILSGIRRAGGRDGTLPEPGGSGCTQPPAETAARRAEPLATE